MITVLAIVVAVLCVAASVRRLLFVLPPDGLDTGEIVVALRGDAGRARFPGVASRVAKLPAGAWEREIFAAASERPAEVRASLLNEQLRERDFDLARWSRVPRVCASIATSSGLLLATTALRAGLQDPDALAADVGQLVTSGAVGQALDVAMVGLAGAVACLALQASANRLAKAELAATDELVGRVEALTASKKPQ